MSDNEPRPPPEPNATVLALGGPIARASIPALCERARELLSDGGADPVVCDVGALVDPDVDTIDALARLQLTAKRLGRHVLLRDACGELVDLLTLTGLDRILPPCGGSGVEPWGQAEEREQALRVQEEADPGDPTA